MRVIHMFRSPSFNVNLGPTFDGLTMSKEDFEVEEYTINVLPFTAANKYRISFHQLNLV
jgi:hypothetical protein